MQNQMKKNRKKLQKSLTTSESDNPDNKIRMLLAQLNAIYTPKKSDTAGIPKTPPKVPPEIARKL